MSDSSPTVLVTRRLPEGSLQPLYDAGLEVRRWDSDDPIPRNELLSRVAEVDGLLAMVTERIDDELFAAAPRLRLVANYAVGYDNIDVPACTRHGVVACNTPGVLHDTTADLTWALILATARRVVESAEYVKRGEWKTWGPMTLLGADVHHATLGIVGMGQIGWAVARRALGFDMRVLYSSRTRRADLEAKATLEFVPLEQLLAQSDFVSLHVSLNPETRHLISKAQLRLMKPTAVLINAARGPIVDQRALYEACRDGVIAGTGLDVSDPEPIADDDPLLSLPNVVVLPHVGSATATTRLRMGVTAARNLAEFFSDRRPPHPLNPDALAR